MSDPNSNLPGGWQEMPSSAHTAIQALWEQNQVLADQVEALRKELNQARHSAVTWAWLFHPLTVLAVSLGAALAFAAFIVIDNDLSGNPDRHGFYLYYIVPISAPFVAFLFDRASRFRELHVGQWAVDLPVIMLSLVRAFTALPGISGHALFLTYALLTSRSRISQTLAVLVLAQVIYLKIFVWQDPTLYGGMLAATAAAGIFWLIAKRWGGQNAPEKGI